MADDFQAMPHMPRAPDRLPAYDFAEVNIRKPLKKRLALVAVATAILAVFFVAWLREQNKFTAKYRLVDEGMTYEEAVDLLGPADAELALVGPTGSGGIWYITDGTKRIRVEWEVYGTPPGKHLVSKELQGSDGSLISIELFGRLRPQPWWQRVLKDVGLY